MAEKEKKLKKTKTEKTYSRKKLPGLLKKAYEEKKFSKKIIDRLYIESDKNEISKLFEKGASQKYPDRLSIPQDKTFTKAQIKKYKAIAKDIKNNAKFRFALLPFAAVVCALAAFVIVVITFKNPLAKKGIKAACEGIFGAKTDIESVNLEILGASLTVKNIQIGNKDDDFKNLFEAEKIELNFNLTQLLRGKFVCQNIECSGMKFGTERTESCALPEKKKALSSGDSAFTKELKERSEKALEELKAQAQSLVGGSDAESIAENLKSQLKTPEAAKVLKESAEQLSSKWKEKPQELKKQVDEFSVSVKELQEIKTDSISDLAKAKDAIAKINSALKQADSLKKSFSTVTEDVKKDSSSVTSLSKSLSDAVSQDQAFIKEKAGSLIGTVSNPSALLNNAVNTVGYNMLGKYYPYAKELLDYALEMKRTSASKSKTAEPVKEKQESKRKRMEGTTYWYSSEYPGFLIERVYASGPDFEGKILELSSDPDVRNKPVTADAKFTSGAISHSGNLTIDARSTTSEPLLAAAYTGKGFTANIDGEKIASGAGIPSIEGNAALSFTATGDSDGISVSGTVGVNSAVLTSEGFSNELATKYYKAALASIKNVELGVKAGFTTEGGLILDIDGNLASQFEKAFMAAAGEAVSDAKNKVMEKLNEKINASNSDAVLKAKEFLGIQDNINLQETSLSDIQKKLDAKKKELEDKIAGKAKAKATEAAGSALEKAGLDSSKAGKVTDKVSGKIKLPF
ncbi:MAG: TIGR03545 family protein [Treponema sp.]|nr:TIGR03545 family protein [Treponema sp.]